MLLYFQVAKKYNIMDFPNHRSAHTQSTIRGGGIIIPLAFILFITALLCRVFVSPQSEDTSLIKFLPFAIGLILISTVSFVDDLISLSSKLRIVIHVISTTFLLLFINAFAIIPIWAIPLLYILVIGILNAFNFMDGINGMTGLYSIILLVTLLYVNSYIYSFCLEEFIVFPLLASLVFLFFNFRKKARCFMGDVGSFGIAFWVVALLGLLITKTQDVRWLLLLTMYGVEVVITIIERIRLRENITEAHRRHLYQLLVNEIRVPHLWVSTLYVAVQISINLFVLTSEESTWLIFILTLTPVILGYSLLKFYIQKKITSVYAN